GNATDPMGRPPAAKSTRMKSGVYVPLGPQLCACTVVVSGLAAGRVAPVETSVVAMGAVKRKSATANVAVALFEASVFDCAMIDAVPGATPVTFPMASTQVTAVFVEYHCTEPVSPTNWAAIRTVRPT